MSCCIPDDVHPEDKIPSKVNNERRWQNRVAGLTFIACVLIQYGLGIGVIVSVGDPLACTGLGSLSFTDVDLSASFGAALKEHVGAFLLTIGLALCAGFAWIFSLQKCATAVVWGTLVFEMLLAVGLAIASFVTPGGALVGLGVTILVFDGIALLVVIFKKKAIDTAAIMLQNAAYCIQYNCSLVVVALGILIMLVAYDIIPIAALALSFIAGDWVPYDSTCVPATTYCDCYLSQPSWINAARVIIILVKVWTFFVSSMMRTYVCGVTTALWYWHPESKGRPCTALKWAASYSFGTLTLAGLVVTIIDRVNQWASSKVTACCCLCCNPLYLIMAIIMMIYKEIVNALAKFCVVIAAITGEDFFVCVGRSYYTLKSKFTTLFVVDGVAKLVLYSAAGVFAAALWAFAWFVAAGISGEDTIAKQTSMWQVSLGYQILQILLWILAGVLLYYPMVGMIVIVLWGATIYGVYFGTSFIVGLFAGALANYLFTFFADVILDVVTSMFTIVCIDSKNGIKITGDGQEGSPSYVGSYYQRLTETEMTVTTVQTVQVQQQQQVLVQQPVVQSQIVMAQPVMMQQPMMMQPQPVMMVQGGYQQPYQQPMAQPYQQQPYAQPYQQQPPAGGYQQQQPPPGYENVSDPYAVQKQG